MYPSAISLEEVCLEEATLNGNSGVTMIQEKVVAAIVKGTGGCVEKCRLFCMQSLAKVR